LQQELANAKQQVEDMAINVQTLQDQNSLLKAQNSTVSNSKVSHNGHPQSAPNPVDHQELRQKNSVIEKLEKELRVRDDIIHELEVRLTLPSNSDDLMNINNEETIDYSIEIKNLQTQLEALQKALANKDNEIEALNIALENRNQVPLTNGNDDKVNEDKENEYAKLKESFSTLQSEQEDLLMMLSEQDVKLRGYKKIIKGLGHPLSEDEDDDLDLSD